jgi:hypothetical protein
MMSQVEWLMLYFGGVILSIIMLLSGDEGITKNGKRFWGSWLGVALWPLLLPVSFLALWLSLSAASFSAALWVTQKLGCTVTLRTAWYKDPNASQ